jgi:hypothetical protein
MELVPPADQFSLNEAWLKFSPVENARVQYRTVSWALAREMLIKQNINRVSVFFMAVKFGFKGTIYKNVEI